MLGGWGARSSLLAKKTLGIIKKHIWKKKPMSRFLGISLHLLVKLIKGNQLKGKKVIAKAYA